MLVTFLLCAFKGGLRTVPDELFATLDASGVRAVNKETRSSNVTPPPSHSRHTTESRPPVIVGAVAARCPD